jgi:hypothetical protein
MDNILDLRLPVTRDGICIIIVGMTDPVSMGIAVETVLLAGLQDDIDVLPV